MKFKIMDKEPIYLAGVVHYGPLKKSEYSKRSNDEHVSYDFDDENFRDSIDELKKNAQSLRDQIADEMKFHSEHFGNDYREHRRRWKDEGRKVKEAERTLRAIERRNRDDERQSRTEERQRRAEEHRSKSEGGGTHNHNTGRGHYDDDGYMFSFEGAMEKFGNVMESFGKQMQKNAGNWDRNIHDWGENFEKNMEDFGRKMDHFGEAFGGKMEAWGEDFGKRMEEWGESFGEKWDRDFDEANKATAIRRYPIYRTYEEVYGRYIVDHPDHIKKQTFYEVQIMDSTFDDVATMVMIGSRMEELDSMRYPVATMTFEPDAWVAVKLTPEEYSRDWLGGLEKVDQLKDYTIDPYFIIRHKKDSTNDEIRLFCPIRNKSDER